jgi:isoleucyl-tRNA synthetase
MPFAQWGYQGDSSPLPRGEGLGARAAAGASSPTGRSTLDSSSLPNTPHQGEGTERAPTPAEKFLSQFPADFISEAIDQTRGWFYSQLAISTMLFGSRNAEVEMRNDEANAPNPHSAFRIPQSYPHPFRTCIVLGLMLGEDGQKMSKSKRNYREPQEIFDRYGADALRWYFFANQPPWTSIRYSEQAIRDSIPEFLLRLWNVYSFFTIYANIDGFNPAAELSGSLSSAASKLLAGAPTYRPLSERSELDRWILSELHGAAAAVVDRMDQYDNFAACAAITQFVDALSNWYVRRSRDRFWAADKRSAGKLDAYWTLYECLLTTAKLIAPFTPFLAESLWQNLAAIPFGDRAEESVHLCEYPAGDGAAIDQLLSERMNLVRHIASLGRQARTAASLKVRQPLARVEVILADTKHQSWLEQHASVIADELNVKQVEFSDQPDKYVTHEVLPNFKLLGPRLGKLMPKVKPALAKQSGAELLANIRDNGKIDLVIDGEAVALTPDEVEVRLQAKPGWTAANDKGVVVVLATDLTPELLAEGIAREIVRVIQDVRKDMQCEFTDRIEIRLWTDDEESMSAAEKFRDYIMGETLAVALVLNQGRRPANAIETKLGQAQIWIAITRTAESDNAV